MKHNLRDVFEYRDGYLYWKSGLKRANDGSIRQYPEGAVAGGFGSKGYWQVSYKNRKYLAHNVVWELHNGPVPEGFTVDHRDRNPTNNRIENLRLATKTQQSANTKKWSLSKTASRWKGVIAWRKPGKWRLFVKGKYCGLFDCEYDAATAYNFLAYSLFGDFTCFNVARQTWLED